MTATVSRPVLAASYAAEHERLRVGVIGYGYWGPNLARNVATNPDSVLWAIADLSPRRLSAARELYPLTAMTTDYTDLLRDRDIDAVFVATPPDTHHRVVIDALEAGKHVLVEKPLAISVEEAEEMVATAKRCGRVLAVDHTFLFTGAVKRMKEYVAAGEVGELYYFDSIRINLGLFNHETNVVWDLAPHDVSIMLHLVAEPVRRVSAFGARHVDTNVENIAYITLEFESPLLAHFHVNWLAPAKVRRTIVGGSKKMLVYDDGEASEKLRVYDSGASLCASREDMYRTFVEYRTGDVVAPKLDKTEALAAETSQFIRSVRGMEAPVSGGELGLEVVRIIEAAQRSLAAGGAPVEVVR